MKLKKKQSNIKIKTKTEMTVYENYIAIDWSSTVMSIARMSSNSNRAMVEKDLPAKLKVIKDYLQCLRGKTILTIEETTGSQWLYVELKETVDKILICDPYRNSLLKEGPKNDWKDAVKLCELLRAGLLKEVYHSNEESYKIRKLTSSYIDLVKAMVRQKNQLVSIYRGEGKKATIKQQAEIKKEYIKQFKILKNQNKTIKKLTSISGVDVINAVKIFSIVVDAWRFSDKYKYWSYCGLVKYKLESGGNEYGKRNTRYSRNLKEAYKTATTTALRGDNDIREYYETMLKEGKSQKEAKNTITRYIAKSTYSMMKNDTNYKPYSWRNNKW
ncbi:MAG: transposase [Ignavibacteria bacterium]|jgi:hypothetical protein